MPLVEIWLRVARSHYYYFTNEMLIFLMKKTKGELVSLPVTQRYRFESLPVIRWLSRVVVTLCQGLRA